MTELLFDKVAPFDKIPILEDLADVVACELQRSEGVTGLGSNTFLRVIAERPKECLMELLRFNATPSQC